MILPTLALVLGLLPIPQLRSLILTTQTMLIATVGGSLAFVESARCGPRSSAAAFWRGLSGSNAAAKDSWTSALS
jgi:hypothetical protein